MNTKTQTNLTDPVDIKHAIEKRAGVTTGAVKQLAISLGISAPALSQNIHGHRKQEYILQGIADHIGHPVHGVYPEEANE